MSKPRNFLIVVAHPEPQSFNHALAQSMEAALTQAGHQVTVSDLAAEGFRADLGRHDMAGIADPDLFHVQAEQTQAARTDTFAPDIAREQERVAKADTLILQFPLWWGGPPALMKGWIDRVMAYGFSYVDGRRFDSGLFQGRRAMVSVTTGGTVERFSKGGAYGPIEPLLMPIQKLVLGYMGYDVAPPLLSYGVPRTNAEQRDIYLAKAAKAALDLARQPVAPTDAWRTALNDVPEGAWNRAG